VIRTVTLILLDPDGRLLGALPPFPVETPWWPDVAGVIAGAREHHGAEVTVLRLLDTERPAPHGGHVTYLASVGGGGQALRPVTVDLAPHPRRAAWAEPGGPAASLAWAEQALAAAGQPVRTTEQVRTWNLSALWRLTTGEGTVWLKQVPDFFSHEAAVLRWLGDHAPGVTPVPIAAAGGRMLLAHIPGTDRHDASQAERLAMLADLHPVQLRAAGRVGELLALGVPDRRTPVLAGQVRAVVTDHGGPEWEVRLAGLLAGLDVRLAALAGCGVPETLVHGDFHPGNIRSDGVHDGSEGRTIIDWGDSVIGHPAFDLLRMCEGAPEPGELRAAWSRWWRTAIPGCDPERALALIAPVAALRNAAVYAGFLDAIEPSERPYHAADVGHWLEQAAHPAARSPASGFPPGDACDLMDG
jgi:hypothetical protein